MCWRKRTGIPLAHFLARGWTEDFGSATHGMSVKEAQERWEYLEDWETRPDIASSPLSLHFSRAHIKAKVVNHNQIYWL